MIDFMDDWRSLRSAPREDREAILLAVSPSPEWPGYVAIGWWFVPDSPEHLNRQKRELFERFGGWWARGRNNLPFGRPLVAWQPLPEFDFETWQESQDAAQG